MKTLRLVGLVAAAGLALTACSGTGQDDDGASGNKKDFTYAVITHSSSGDAFWDRVKSGAEQAGDDYGVTVQYDSDPDPAGQSQKIDGAVADKVDGIVVSMANPDGLETSIKAAVAAGIPVVTINSGVDRFQEFGAITHIGQSETIAGQAVGQRLKDEGLSNVICVIQEAGNVGLEERCKAVGGTLGGKVENLQVDGTDDAAVQATITSKLQADSSIDGVLTLGGQYAIDAVGAVEQAGSKAKVGDVRPLRGRRHQHPGRQDPLRRRPAALRPGLPRGDDAVPQGPQRQRRRWWPAGQLRSCVRHEGECRRRARVREERYALTRRWGLVRRRGPTTPASHRDRRRTMATATAQPDERLATTGPVARLLKRPEIGALVAALVVFLFFALTTETFATPAGASTWLQTSSTIGIMAVAVSLLMIGGEFDLSAGVMTGFTGLTVGVLTTH